MDPYAPCPCGSGKKLKFCCQEIVGEMEKIERLQENNQPRMALQLLEKVEKSHPANPWIVTHKALALIDDQRPEEAAAGLLRFLHTDPNHPFANAIYGIASYNAEGYPAAKKAVHRAFRRSVREFPGLVATLAASIARDFIGDGRYLAARAHLALALRAGIDEQRRQMILALLELDGDSSIPFPLRGAHHLPDLQSAAGDQEAIPRIQPLAACGCFQEAADLLEQTAGDNDLAEVWHAVGLLRGWDGDESAAAAALHRAAANYPDYETAVECETLAQLLDQVSDDNTAKLRLRRFQVESVAQLLTLLDSADRVVRVDRLDEPEKRDGDPVARYLILDRDVPPESALEELDRDTAPQSLARVTVFDRSENEDDPAYLYLSGLEGETLQQSADVLTSAVGELLSRVTNESESEDEIAGVVPREQLPFYRNYYLPPRTPGAVRRRIQLGHWESIINDDWITTPQTCLDGRSPQSASDDPAARVKLGAAVNVLDVFCGSRGYICPLSEVRERLRLPETTSLECTEGQNLTSLSLLQLQRLDLASLPDTQLQAVVQRALLVRHPRQAYEVLKHVLENDRELEESGNRQDACAALADVCRDSLRRDEALQWVSRGRELAQGGADEFEAVLQWKMRELMLRIDDPDDPERDRLLNELWDTYGAKLPSLRQHLSELVTALDIEAPWSSSILTPAGGGDPAQGVWTGEGSAAATAEKKLWLPGDD